jgi:RNA polymerase sigma factor for flagellar operon FliA
MARRIAIDTISSLPESPKSELLYRLVPKRLKAGFNTNFFRCLPCSSRAKVKTALQEADDFTDLFGQFRERYTMATSSLSSAVNLHATCLIPPPAWSPEVFQQVGIFTDHLNPAPGVAASKQPDPAAREQILLEHMSVVRFVARRIHERLPQHVELEDLVSAGIVGLIDAFNKFDARKNVQFRSYAQFRIRGAILDSLRMLDWGPRDLRRKARNMEKAVLKLTNRLGRVPTESEVACELGLILGEYQELLGEIKGLEIGSLQESRSDNSTDEELAYVATAEEDDPFFRCMKSEMSERLAAVVATLPEREAKVLAMYYVEEMTMKQIGAALGVVESRVSQIHSSALIILRTRLGRAGRAGRKFPEVSEQMREQVVSANKKMSRSKSAVPLAMLQRVAHNAGNMGRGAPAAR